MITFGVTMVRDEADVIEGVIRHMADEVHHLIVADNLSTDATRPTLERLAAELPLTIVEDPEPGYWQSEKMSGLAELAASMGADWIVPFDADELWSAVDPYPLRDLLAGLDCPVVTATMVNYVTTALDPDDEPDPFRALCWHHPPGVRHDAVHCTDSPDLPKVAFRWQPGAKIHQGNHGVQLDGSDVHWTLGHAVTVSHFPYRSAAQFRRKIVQGARAYAATNLPAGYGFHWRDLGAIHDRGGDQALDDVYRRTCWFADPEAAGLVHDPAPYLRWRK